MAQYDPRPYRGQQWGSGEAGQVGSLATVVVRYLGSERHSTHLSEPSFRGMTRPAPPQCRRAVKGNIRLGDQALQTLLRDVPNTDTARKNIISLSDALSAERRVQPGAIEDLQTVMGWSGADGGHGELTRAWPTT